MTTSLFSLLAVAPARLDPLDLFLQADIVVKVVMIGLIVASIWVWTIIVSFSLRMRQVEQRSTAFESDFWDAEEFDSLTSGRARKTGTGCGERPSDRGGRCAGSAPFRPA